MIGWFLVPMVRRDWQGRPMRDFLINDIDGDIRAAGGMWDGTEILGNQAIVKVSATEAILTQVQNLSGVRRIPINQLDTPLSEVSAGVRNALRQEILDAGYTVGEVTTQFPNIADATLRQVLKFMASRRLKPRYDSETDTIHVDGAMQTCRQLEDVERRVN